MTLGEICGVLQDAGIENAREEALLIVCALFGKSRASVLADPDADFESEALFAALDKRVERYPLQYIFGEWSFFGEEYRVSEDCLIPRSDTELLVAHAIKTLPRGAHFADLCTGSGCIAISTLVHRPDCTATAVDVFPKTLALATENAERNGVRERFCPVLADLLAPPTEDILDRAPFDAIVSNPPYIRSAVVDALEPELFFEPRAALDGGTDGLVFYRRIIESFLPLLKADGCFIFEIGFDGANDLRALAREHGLSCEIKNDLSGNARMAILKQ